jgi:hypothetical protein
MSRSWRYATLAAGLALLAAFASGAAASAEVHATGGGSVLTAANSSLVTVVHGLRGQLVDVYLDSKLLLPAFQPDRITDPTQIASGPHQVDLRPAGAAADSAPKASQSVVVPAGQSLSIVAHFDAAGGWAMTVFTNDVSRLPAGQGRLVFRNTSAIAPVSVQLDGAPVTSLAAAQQFSQVVPAKSYQALAQSGADSSTLVPSNSVTVADGSDTVLYLVGQGQDVTWLTQSIGGLDTAPAAIPTGNSGLASPSDSFGLYVAVLGAALGAVALGLASLNRRRHLA